MRPSADELSTLGLFAGLPADGLAVFAEAAELCEMPAGEVIYYEGDVGDAVYVVHRGSVQIVRAIDGHVLNVLAEGDFFGEMAFVDMQPRSATVRVADDAVLWRWSYVTLAGIRDKDLKAFTLLFMNIAREISRRLRRADARLAG